jgi:lysophospholipase L1-like esterase
MTKTIRSLALTLITALVLVLGVATTAAGDVSPARKSLLVIGDSYSAGYVGYGYGAEGWPARLAKEFDLDLTLNAVPGTGFVRTTNGEQNAFANRWRTGLTPTTDYVIIAGSRNDWNQDPQAVYSKARAMDAAIRTVAPKATILYVGPMWGFEDQGSAAQPLEDAVRAASSAVGDRFVDGSDWLNSHPDLVVQGHPNNGGHKVIEAEIANSFAPLT